MSFSATAPQFDVGDTVVVRCGTYHGSEGRIVLRKPIEVHLEGYYRRDYVYEVEFDSAPKRSGFRVQFQPHHLERI